jgi:hypothetical protein
LIIGLALMYVDNDKINGSDKTENWLHIAKNAILYILFPVVIAYLVFKDAVFSNFTSSILDMVSPFENVLYVVLGGLGLYIIYKGMKAFGTNESVMGIVSKIIGLLFTGGWIYLFIQLFTFSLENISLLIIPILYLIVSAVYLFVTQYNANMISGSMYATVAILFITVMYSIKINQSVIWKTLYTVVTSLVSSWSLSNSDIPLSYIPFLLLISITLMVISSMIILISHNVYEAKYKEKTGKEPEELSGEYKDYYDGYVIRMKWFIASSILTTAGYSFYMKSVVESQAGRSKQSPNLTDIFTGSNAAWLSTNISGILMNIFASREIFNSYNFLDISRRLII